MNLQPVILSGGAGTRLWPLSREYYPKQLLTLTSDASLLQDTLTRLAGLSLPDSHALARAIIVSNEEHRFLVAEQARSAGIELDKIILEPFGRNTAPALTLAALAITANGGDAVMLVMPADHVIKNIDIFHEAVRAGFVEAEQGGFVTFGIVPTHPETGYGYIKRGQSLGDQGSAIFALDSFVEKPDRATAQGYLDAGCYYWNSGMFMMKASVWLKAIEKFNAGIYKQARSAFDAAAADLDFLRIDKDAFAACPSDSIDYAVMEKITGPQRGEFTAAVLPLDAGWSDIGSWSSLWQAREPDSDGNVVSGDVYMHDSSDSLVLSESRLVSCIGVEDLIVVETADAVLVASKDSAQDVKKIVEMIKLDDRQEHMIHLKVHRPWGFYEGVDKGERFQVKRITVNPGATLSLQMHHHRAEHWVVVKGTARVTKGDDVFLISENESTYIPIGVRHRLENPGSVPLEIIEVQSGSYLGEDDIVRFEDIYGRGEEQVKQ